MGNPLGDFPNYQSVQQLLAGFYGGAFVTKPHESDYTIGTSAVTLAATNEGVRVGTSFSNTGATNIAISFNPAITITTGFLLLPGGFFSLDWYYDGDLLNRTLYGISSAAGGTLHQLERFLVGG